MPRLTIKSEGGPHVQIQLRKGLNTLGRSSTNDFAIEHASVSGHHCVIALEDSGMIVRDLGSTNGTYIDGRPITEENLREGQVLRLGDVELVWESGPARVFIPHFEPPPAPEPVVMSDGTVACLNHPASKATYSCPQCRQPYCTQCVHHLRMIGARMHHLCPVCSNECERLGPDRAKKKSILGRIKDAVGALLKPKDD